MKKLVLNIFVWISIILLGWVFISWIDIAADNMKPNPEHADWNVFVILSDEFKEVK